MKKYYLLLLIGILFVSCSTLINQSTTTINIHSDEDVKVSVNNDTINWHTIPATIAVQRSKEDLVLTVRNDTTQKQLNIKSYLSTAFWLGNLFNGAGVIGYAVDLTNSKRYSYPSAVFIDLDNNNTSYSIVKYATWLNPVKNLLSFKISIPEGNWLYLNTGNGYGNRFGFLGISAGIEYYLTNKYCLNIDFGGLTDFMLPVPAPVDYGGSYNSSFAVYGDIQLGSDYKRMHYDVGFQFNKTSYYERETIELFPEYIDTLKYSVKQVNFGVALSTYYRISKKFNIGINYYPSFIAIQDKKAQLHYSHLLFLELIFRKEVYRNRKK